MKATTVPLPTPSAQPATELWLVRHAEVEERYQRAFGGRIDMALSARGTEQAAALAQYWHQTSFAALYASPMRRVQQTLAPSLGNGLPPPVVLAELREIDFGDWSGLRFEEIEAKYGVSISAWLELLDSGGIPKAESVPLLRSRVEGCLQQILRKHPGERVAVACHGGVIRVVLSLLLGLPLPQFGAFKIDYASITQVLLRPGEVRLQLLNFAPWRDLRRAAAAN